MKPDPVARRNERVKLLAVTANALGLAVIGFGVLRPAIEPGQTLGWDAAAPVVVGLVLHLTAHYILGKIRKEDP